MRLLLTAIIAITACSTPGGSSEANTGLASSGSSCPDHDPDDCTDGAYTDYVACSMTAGGTGSTCGEAELGACAAQRHACSAE